MRFDTYYRSTSQMGTTRKKISNGVKRYWRKKRARQYQHDRRDTPQRFAREAANEAEKIGLLVKPAHCEEPGCNVRDKLDKHHESYSPENWLKVVWLCRKHHRLRHSNIK